MGGFGGRAACAADSCDATVTAPDVSLVANALGLQQLGKEAECSVEVCLALATAIAGLPDPHLCAREVSWAWAAQSARSSESFREVIMVDIRDMWGLAAQEAPTMRPHLPEGADAWSPVDAVV